MLTSACKILLFILAPTDDCLALPVGAGAMSSSADAQEHLLNHFSTILIRFIFTHKADHHGTEAVHCYASTLELTVLALHDDTGNCHPCACGIACLYLLLSISSFATNGIP